MLNVPEAIKTLLKNESVPKNFRIHFPNGEFSDITNENLVAESVRFSESICSQGSFRFGLAEASAIEFETIGIGNMIGCTIEVSCEINYNNEPYSIPYGKFVVNKCPRNHENMTLRRVTAYTENLKPYTLPVETKKNTLTEYCEILKDCITLSPSEMTLVPYDGSNVRIDTHTPFNGMFNSNGSRYMDQAGFRTWHARIGGFNPSKVMIINVHYQESQYDHGYDAEFIRMINSCNFPSGFMYEQYVSAGGSVSYKRVLSDSKQAMHMLYYPCCKPCYIIRLSNNDGSKIGYTAPVFIEPDVNIPIILKNETILYNSITLSEVTSATVGIIVPVSYSANSGLPVFQSVNTTTQEAQDYSCSYNPLTQGYVRPGNESVQYGVWTTDIELRYKTYDISDLTEEVLIKSTATNSKDATYFKTYNTYINAFDSEKFIRSMLELNAQFMKPDREGNFEAINLLNTPQEYLVPNDYISLWWDEYNVEPIGTVRYSYKDASGVMQTVDYNFGTGKSLYDMSDNFVLQNLVGASPEVINGLLDTYFIPHLSNIVFTPIDFYMRGLPYLEAGDLIDIESEDGVHVQSYIMTMDIDGIHNLTADITSVDGDTLYSEVTT